MQVSQHARVLSILLPALSGDALSRRRVPFRPLFHVSILAAALSCICSSGLAGAECIDYRDYIHWVGCVDTPGDAWGVAVSGFYAYVADDYSGLQVIDITNPQSPEIVGSADTPGSAKDVTVSGFYAYVADYYSGLQVIDISDPQSPEIVGSANTTGSARGVAVSGARAYLAGGSSGLQVIDISDPQSPEIVGSADKPGRAQDVAVSG
ncbi:MAG: hypothetical protein KJ927_16775, partial [Candidatus Eisenbacteria bacterium]|nr:hypothetical protein [Candidatus Eisenbacteria bacterium]